MHAHILGLYITNLDSVGFRWREAMIYNKRVLSGANGFCSNKDVFGDIDETQN